jgi:hypothetical protein
MKKLWLTTKELAEEWGLTPNTLEQWRSRGIGPPAHYLNRAARYYRPKAEVWAGLNPEMLPEDKVEMDKAVKEFEASAGRKR